MSIRNSFFLALSSLVFLSHGTDEKETKEWKQFKRTHDLVLLIKNTKKNEDRVVVFPLRDLGTDEYDVAWIEREDFLPKDITWSTLEISEKDCQCHRYEHKVGAEDEQQTMLTVGLPDPLNKQYQFIMNDTYTCMMAVTVVNKLAYEKPTTKEKAREYFSKFKNSLARAWSKVSGKK